MFLIESFRDYRSTEPIWFRFFRGFFAMVLAMTLIYYSIAKLILFDSYNDVPIVASIYSSNNGIQLNMSICTGISNVMKSDVIPNEVDEEYEYLETMYQNNNIITSLTPYCQSVHLQYRSPVNTYWLNINTTASSMININDDTQKYMNISKYLQYPYNTSLSIPNNGLFLIFESFQFDIIIDKTFSFSRNGAYDEESKRSFDLEPTHFLLYLGQASLITFKPKVIDDTEVYSLELNPRLEQLPINLEPNEIQLGINFPSNTLYFEKIKRYASTDLVADLGGFYSAIAGIYILFFGMQKHEPWGLAQKYILSYIPCRQSFTRKFARKYVSSAGIPLVEKVKRPEETPLEERVQMLETVLQDYYLDDYLLKEVKIAKNEHKKFDKMKQKNNGKTKLVSWV